MSELPDEFFEKHTWELWVIFLLKLITSLVFLIDDLTFLVFCEYEFNMTQSEAGLLFCITALFLFTFGLTISGYIIDRIGVKYSLILGFLCISIAKFVLTFADSLSQLYFIMCSISPFGISIIFPCLILGVKKLTDEGPFRKLCFSIYFAFMVIGGILGGPIVDFIRKDIGKT
jgi:MFS family permease